MTWRAHFQSLNVRGLFAEVCFARKDPQKGSVGGASDMTFNATHPAPSEGSFE
jgi:hypothetical protein